MMIEPQSQLPSLELGGSMVLKNPGSNIMRSLTPGGLGDHAF